MKRLMKTSDLDNNFKTRVYESFNSKSVADVLKENVDYYTQNKCDRLDGDENEQEVLEGIADDVADDDDVFGMVEDYLEQEITPEMEDFIKEVIKEKAAELINENEVQTAINESKPQDDGIAQEYWKDRL